MSEDIFLLSLVTIASRLRGRKFVLKEEEAVEVVDKWLCLLAGVMRWCRFHGQASLLFWEVDFVFELVRGEVFEGRVFAF
jgi:hypothetical protein